MAWTEERVELLKRLRKEGLSFAQIAQQMGGLTRGAVAGKIYYLGLTGARPVRATSSTPITHKPSMPKPKPKPVVPHLRAEDIKPLATDDLSVMTVDDEHCRWPVDRPGTEGVQFCGQPKDGPNKDGVPSAYCASHRALGTNSLQGRKGNGKWKRT